MVTTPTPKSTPLASSGMGAIPNQEGTAFRVWAPFASSVSVVINFSSEGTKTIPLTKENNGNWSTYVLGAKSGDQYDYKITNGSQTLTKSDPYSKQLVNSVGNSIIPDTNFDWGTENFTMPPWNELVIYELHIGSFNGTPGGKEGNFDSAIQKFSYLQDLGINAIEVMPVEEFAGAYSWGYNPAYPYAVEEVYGGPQALKKFIKAAHEHGIAVILDVVYNHFGPQDLGLWQFDGWSENGKGGIYFYNDWRCKTPWGDTRPDYGRGEVRQYIHNNALMWLEEYRVDGLRFDATAYITNVYGRNNDSSNDIPEAWSLMQWINNEVDSQQPGKITIAEDLRNNEWITKTTGAGGAGFDSQWSTGKFLVPVRNAITLPDDDARDMYAVRDAIYHRFNTDVLQRVIYTECHDEVANGKSRVPEEISPGNAGSWYSRKRSTIGAALVFTAPGIPMIFQGQEILENGYFRDTTLIDWSKLSTYAGIHNMYRDLIRLRRNWDKHTRGLIGQNVNVHYVNNNDKMIAFHRWQNGGAGDDVIVVVNMANRSFKNYNIGFPRDGYWKVRFNSDWNSYSSDFGNFLSYDTTASIGDKDGMAFNGNIGIGPYSVIILSQDN